MVYPAAVTPFEPSGEIDFPAVVRLLSWFRHAKCDGVVLAGTNGEGPSLSSMERRDLLRHAISVAAELKIVLGISTNSLTEAQWLADQAGRYGAEAVLVTPPGYFKEAGQAGMTAWFQKLLDSSPVPVLVYNIPQRSGVAVEPEAVSELSGHPRFYGVKDSSGVVENLRAFSEAVGEKKLLVGDETLLMKALEAGWMGTISGAANVLASWLVPIADEFSRNQESSSTKFELILPAVQALRRSPQPFTNKEILRRLGVLPSAAMRLPLSESNSEAVEQASEHVIRLVKGAAA